MRLLSCLFAGGCLVRAALAQDAQPPVAQPENAGASATPVAEPASTNGAPGLVIVNAAASRFEVALASFNAGRYAEAVDAFSAFIRDFPQDRRREEALYRLAESYRALGRTKDALAAYAFEVQSYPEGPLRINAQLRRGAMLIDGGKFADAIAPLREVATQGAAEYKDPANYLLGRAYLASGNEAAGRPLLQAFVDAQPSGKFTADAAQALAQLDDTQKKYADAAGLWQKAFVLVTDPAAKSTIAARGGWSALQANQLDVAEKLFQSARSLDPSGPAHKLASTGLLRILFAQKRYSEWVAAYQTEQGKLLEGDRAELLYDLGQSQFSLKHWSEAAAAFDQYLRENPHDPNAVTAAYQRFLALAQIDRTKIVAEAESYLRAWPQSSYRARVQLLEAQQLSAEKKFAEALPLWESLAHETGDPGWPRRNVLLELARAHDELHHWPQAATAYQSYLDELATHPEADHAVDARARLHAQARLAVCQQNAGQLAAATQTWQAVQAQAPAGSPEQQMALESLGLIYAKAGPPAQSAMVATFSQLLEKYPQSPLHALAAFTVGDSLFQKQDYAGAEKLLLEARTGDPATWSQPVTQRLLLGAYGQKQRDQALNYLRQYESLPLPTDPVARESARVPAALFYWLAEEARKAGNLPQAENFYLRVTQHPQPGELLAGAWWQLGQVQARRQEWPEAVASYEKYRKLKPATQNATAVLLALGRAQLGAANLEAARTLGQQALLQEPEGPNSAAARMLLAETAFAAHSYAESARMFATLAVLFDDPKIAPQAMTRAAEAFTAAGDATSAAQWKQKLQAKYPGYQPAPY